MNINTRTHTHAPLTPASIYMVQAERAHKHTHRNTPASIGQPKHTHPHRRPQAQCANKHTHPNTRVRIGGVKDKTRTQTQALLTPARIGRVELEGAHKQIQSSTLARNGGVQPTPEPKHTHPKPQPRTRRWHGLETRYARKSGEPLVFRPKEGMCASTVARRLGVTSASVLPVLPGAALSGATS